MIVYTTDIDIEHTGSGVGIWFKIYWHDTLESILAEYIKGEKQQEDGTEVEYVNNFDADKARALALDCGSWGFCLHALRIIHIWAEKMCWTQERLSAIAHEIGHCIPPFHRDYQKEERKASKYEGVFWTAIYAIKDKQAWDNMNDPMMNGQM